MRDVSTTVRIFVSTPRLRFRRFEGRTVLNRFSQIYLFSHVFDQRKKKIIDHRRSRARFVSSFLRFVSPVLLCSREFHATRGIYRYRATY